MDIVNLPSLLHNKNVVSAILSHIDNTPPTVSYRLTIKRLVSDIDFTIGSNHLTCGYGPAGHVVTGYS